MDRIVTNDYTSVLIPGEGGLKKPMPSLRAVHFYLQDFTRASSAYPANEKCPLSGALVFCWRRGRLLNLSLIRLIYNSL